jgi:hypothetical protein
MALGYGALMRPKDGLHKVREGDTISSIAALYGFTDWEEKVWNAGENTKLKAERVNPNTLMPGDQVFIPELTRKDESRPTDAWHEFHVVRNKRFLRLKLQAEDGSPLANRKYELRVPPIFRGTFEQKGQATDADGKIEEEIPHTLLEADLILPDDNLRTHLFIGYLRPLPASDPVEGPKLDVSASLGGLAGSASGLLDAAKGAVSGGLGSIAGAATGAVSGAAGGALSGGMSIGGGASGGGLSAGGGLGGGLSGGLAGAASGAAGLAGAVKGAASAGAQSLLSSASAMAGPIAGAVGSIMGEGAFGNEIDPNIYPAAQRLDSMGFDPGDPKDNKRTAQFSAALMAFQTFCKEKGSMPPDAGGPLGGLTAPSGPLGGGGGMLGDLAGAVAGPMLAAVGLTGQLDQPTIEAIKKMHGC